MQKWHKKPNFFCHLEFLNNFLTILKHLSAKRLILLHISKKELWSEYISGPLVRKVYYVVNFDTYSQIG